MIQKETFPLEKEDNKSSDWNPDVLTASRVDVGVQKNGPHFIQIRTFTFQRHLCGPLQILTMTVTTANIIRIVWSGHEYKDLEMPTEDKSKHVGFLYEQT